MIDLNKLVTDRPAADTPLPRLAKEINQLIGTEYNCHVAVCIRLAIVKNRLVGPNTKASCNKYNKQLQAFYDWCDANSRSRKGTLFSHVTLQNMIILGKDENPEKRYTKYKQQIVNIASNNAKKSRTLDAIVKSGLLPQAVAFTTHGPLTEDQEINWLVTVWEKTSAGAHKKFLKMVGD